MNMPWNKPELEGWLIVGMNHYSSGGRKHLFCAMTKGRMCITAEGPWEDIVFEQLAMQAASVVRSLTNDA